MEGSLTYEHGLHRCIQECSSHVAYQGNSQIVGDVIVMPTIRYVLGVFM